MDLIRKFFSRGGSTEKETENADVSGDIYVRSNREEVEIYADALHWDDENRTLSSMDNSTVLIHTDDGSVLVGSKFVGDFIRKVFTFEGGVKGRFVYDEE